MRSWLNPTSIVGGVLAVLTCGYLAAIFLTAEASRAAQPELERWSRRRAVIAGLAAGAAAVIGLFVLRQDAHRLYTQLLHDGWPFIVVSVLAGAAALLTTLRGRPALVRPIGVLAVGAVLLGWGVAQYPYLLGTHLSIQEAAAPPATMAALAVVTILAVALVGPSLVLLFLLTTRGRLASD